MLLRNGAEGRIRRTNMKCEEALAKISAYINHTLSGRELKEFIDHVEHCPECYDELETYYTIKVGINYLEQDRQDAYNIPQMLKKDLRQRKERLQRRRAIRWMLMVAAVFVVAAGLLWVAVQWGGFSFDRIL